MSRHLSFLVLLAFLANIPPALASSLEVSVKSDDSNYIVVPPGAEVTYCVDGVLSDIDNRGLALFFFDLEFSGGQLTPAFTPLDAPMSYFAQDLGFSNPQGYGGTVSDGKLLQVGGGQNTIKSNSGYAPYPVGSITQDIGHDQVTLVTGQVTAPMEPGIYTLQLSNLTSSVIKPGRTLPDNAYWRVWPAEAGDITPLTIEVLSGFSNTTKQDCGREAFPPLIPSLEDGKQPSKRPGKK